MRSTLLPAPAAFALVQPRCVLRSSSHQSPFLPCSLKGLCKLAELLPPLKTHGLEFIVTTMQESGLLLALRMVLDPCTTPGQASRLAQPPPLRRGSGLALLWSCTGTAGRWAEQPLGLAPLGHPDKWRGQLLAEMSHTLSRPCPSVVRGWEPSPGHGVAALLLAALYPG